MLHLVRTVSPYTVIILAILTLLLKLQALGAPVYPVADVHHALFGYIVRLFGYVFGHSRYAFTLLALVMCFGQAIYLMSIASRHRLFQRHTYVPAFAYIVLSSLHPALGQFSAPLLANWLLLGALDAALSFTRREEPQRTIYNTGFLLGCAALLHFPTVLYVVFFVLSLMWLRVFRFGEWVVGMLGYLVPAYFAACLLYLSNAWLVAHDWPYWGNGLPRKGELPLYFFGLMAGCLLLIVSGLIFLMRGIYKMPVSVRRGWGAVGTAMTVSIAVALLTPRSEGAAWLCVLPCMALLVIPPMMGDKRSRFATFTFYFMLALVLFCQLALRR